MKTITRNNTYLPLSSRANQNKEYRGYLIDGVQYFHLVDIVDLNDMPEVFKGLDKEEVKFIDNRSELKLLNSIAKLGEYEGLTTEESVIVSWNGLVKRLCYRGDL